MKKQKGFTLAEVLITLSIIGVIAALVIPSLMMNYQYRAVGTKLSKFMSTLENTTRAYVVSNEGLSGYDNGDENDPDDHAYDYLNPYLNAVFSYTQLGVKGNDGIVNSNVGQDSISLDNYIADTAGTYNNFATQFNYGPYKKKTYQEGDDPDPILTQDKNRVFLKDGTNVMFTPVVDAAAGTADSVIWNNKKVPRSTEIGNPILSVVLDPQATGLPSSVQRVFGFVVTDLGYVFPHPADDCAWEILNANWVTNPKTFESTACSTPTIAVNP